MRFPLVLASFAAPLAFCALASLACSSNGATSDAGAADDAGDPCPADALPSACPSPEPSWSKDVEPIVASKCWACHADGGVESSKNDLSTYDAVYFRRSPVLSQVYSCRMPDVGAPPLTPQERATMLAWLVCGAPNN